MPYDNADQAPRLPDGPVNLDAEIALLGCVLADNSVFPNVSHLKAEAFAEPGHGRFWAAICAKINSGALADPGTLHNALANDPAYQDLGGPAFMADLITSAPVASFAHDYAQAVQDCFIRRDLMRFGVAIRQSALDPDGRDSQTLMSDVRRDLDALEAETALDDASMIAAPFAAANALKNMQDTLTNGRVRGRMTGLRCIDRRLGGLRPGALIVVGGRPGMGKTALARAIASGASERSPDVNFAFLGIEMGPEEMMQRELSARTFAADGGYGGDSVKYQDMGRGNLTPLDLANINVASRHVPSNLILDDCHSLSVEDVRRKVWSLKRRGPLAAIVIDYFQLMRRPPAQGRNEASVLGQMTQALKLLARQAGICIVLLSQLSRQVEYRDDKRPQLSDLRETGSLEQDADAVLFPYREVYYLERAEPKDGPEHTDWEVKCADLRNVLDVICAKQRQGAVGTDRQTYHPEYDHIEDRKE